MSTAQDIVQDAATLVEETRKLMESESTQAVVDIAHQLKCGAAVTGAADLMIKPFSPIEKGLSQIRTIAQQTTALEGLLGLLRPMVSGTAALAAAGSEDLARIGLPETGVGQVKSLVGAVSERGERVLASGEAFLDGYPAPEDIDRLTASFRDLAKVIDGFKHQVEQAEAAG